MERGHLSGIALNGGGMIHDFELALVGATTESVARYLTDGQFGLWRTAPSTTSSPRPRGGEDWAPRWARRSMATIRTRT